MRYLELLIAAGIVVVLAAFQPLSAQGPDAPASTSVRASDSALPAVIRELWRAGGFLGIHRNVYKADDIKGLPDVPSCCPEYSTGGGFGVVIGATAGLPAGEQFDLNFRVGYSTYSGQLRSLESEIVDVNPVGSDSARLALATFEHTIDAELHGLSLESFLSFRATPRLFLSAGLRGDFLVRTWFHQKEFLASPEGITFENGKRTRQEFEGDIPRAQNLQGALVANVRYEFPMNPDKNIVLAPEISGWYALTNVVDNLPWGAHGLRAGISLQYLHLPQPEVQEEPEESVEEPIEPIRSGPLVPRATEPGGSGSGSGEEKEEGKEE